MKLILFFICLITFLFMGESMAQQNINKLSTKELTVNGKVEVNSTTLSSKPCPAMTETQRNAIAAPVSGSCVYNTTTLQLNVYNGSIWKSAGGGISNWETAFNYAIGDVVIESNKIYQANTAHTSSVFASDIANWTQIANNVSDAVGVLPLANGGTNKNTTASAGSVVYSDADSFELTSVGTAGQVLKSNGASAPGFAASSIKAKAENASSVDAEEIQFPNNQLTETAAGKYLSETGNRNILANPSFEHTTFDTGWTVSGSATVSAETSSPLSGKKSFKAVMAANAVQVYQDSTLYAGVLAGTQGVIRFSASNTAPGATCYQRAAGVKLTGANNQVVLAADGLKRSYEIPVVLSATSNGVECDTGTTAGTLILDDFEISDSLSLPEVSQAQLAGASYFASTSSCSWSRTSTTLGAFTTTAACPGPTVVSQSVGEWQTTDSNLPRQTINNLPPGIYVAKFFVRQNAGAATDVTLSIFDGTTTCVASAGINQTGTGGILGQVVSCPFVYTSSGNRNFEVYAQSASSSVALLNSPGTGYSYATTFELYYYPPASKIYSQANNNFGPTPYTPTITALSGSLTNFTSAATYQRNGNIITVRGTITFTGAVGTWANPVISLPSGLTPTLTTRALPLGTGSAYDASVPSTYEIVVSGISGSGIYLGRPDYTNFTQATPVGWVSSDVFTYQFSVPVNEWTNPAQITGTFREVMTVPGVSKPVQFGFRSSAACTTGSCPGTFYGDTIGAGSTVFTSTGVYTTTIPSGKCAATPWCEGGVQAFTSTQFRCNISPSSATSISTTCLNNTPAVVNEGFHFMCWCQAP